LDRDVNAARNILNRAGHARWGQSTTVGLGLPQEASPL
jgi:transposase